MSKFIVSIPLNNFSSGASLRIALAPYILDLRAEFGTSHSSTSRRTNALVQISFHRIDRCSDVIQYGYGEIGLPPKKKGCYLADYEDIRTYVALFSEELNAEPLILSKCDPFEELPEEYFSNCRRSSGVLADVLKSVLCRMDECSANGAEYSRAARCGLEMALFDLWGKHTSQPLSTLLGLFSPTQDESYRRKGFYTVAINSDIDAVLSVIHKEACSSTRFFKIKINHDVPFIAKLLNSLAEAFPPIHGIRDWVLDANAAWSTSIAIEFVAVIAPYKDRIYMLEQPFPVEFLSDNLDENLDEWKRLKDLYSRDLGILWFADESVSTSADILQLQPYVQGCNIKLEKAGGFRGAILAMHTARSLGMKLWSGMMVGSDLAASAPGHLLSLVSEDAGVDLDGSLLVTPASSLFTGGVQYQSTGDERYFGYMKWPSIPIGQSFGMACTAVGPEPLISYTAMEENALKVKDECL